jgi:epoxyqueuosine reductase
MEMSLREYLELSDAEFRTLFRNSPIKRIKRRGFLRNVCVALGNAGDTSDIPALERAARDPEPLIAEHARWAIDRIRYRRKQRSERFVNPAEARTASHS